MIVVMTVVMLLTFIPLAIFTQAMQQLPLARHDQDHESALARGRSRRRRLPQPPEPEQQLLAVQRDERGARRQPGVHELGPRARTGRQRRVVPVHARHDEDRRSSGTIYLTSTGQVAQRHAHGEGRHPAPGLPRLPVPDRLRDRRPRALRRPDLVRVPRVAEEHRVADRLRARTRRTAASCTGPTAPSLNGPVHTNDGLYVCGSPHFNGDTDTYYNSPASQSVANSTRFVGPGSTLNPLSCSNTPVFQRLQRPGERREPAVPARQHRDPHAGRRRGRRPGLPLHRADDDHAAQLGQHRADGRRERGDEVDEPGLWSGHQPRAARERRGLRADRAELVERPELLARAPDRAATATPT